MKKKKSCQVSTGRAGWRRRYSHHQGGRGEGPLASSSYLLDLLALDDRVVPPYLLRPVLAVVEGAAVLVAVAMHGAEKALTPTREPCGTTHKRQCNAHIQQAWYSCLATLTS